MKGKVFVFAALALAACRDASVPTSAPLNDELAVVPLATRSSSAPRPGHYIVVFRDGVSDARGLARALVAAHNGVIEHTYVASIKGFAAQLPAAAIGVLRNHPDVVLVEQDATVAMDVTQTGATWGIDRIDQRSLPLSTTYTYTATGSGVNAYILDTGIRTTHSEFGGRATAVFTSVNDGNGTTDCNGHGTHVAGTVGGATYGVAKQVKLFAVRVLDCGGNGTTSGVIAGIDWVTANRVLPAVANMSLGGGPSDALDQAVVRSIAAGVSYSLSAGNSNADACFGSPSRVGAALTIGSTTSTDLRSSFSNWGPCLDLFAPGSSITSSYNGNDTQTAVLSGTSMAAPHVAGVIARYLQLNPGASPATVSAAIVNNATNGVVGNPGSGSPNRLLFASFVDAAPNAPPVARFTISCSGLTCTFDGRSSTDDVGVVSYDWDLGKFPDRYTSGPVVSATYPHEGQRTVVLTVTDGSGQTNSVSQTFQVGGPPPNQPPVAAFTASCTNLSCTFNSSGSSDDVGITNRSGTFGDGTTAGNVVSPNKTYSSAGTYTVTLTVTDGGGLTNSTSQQVTVTAPPPPNQPPVASFTASCTNLSCTFNSSGSSDDVGITNRSWTFGDGTTAGNVVSPNKTYASAGTYTVTLTVTDGGGLTNSTSQQVTVTAPPPTNQPPVARFTISCTGLTCTFDGRTSTDDKGVVSYAWDLGKFPDRYTNGPVATATYPHSGPRTVVLTVTDAEGLTSTVSQTFTVQD